MEIAEITGKKGKWIRKAGYASILVNGEERYIGERAKKKNVFIIEDTANVEVLFCKKRKGSFIISHSNEDLAKIYFPTFLKFREEVEFLGTKYPLPRRNIVKVSDFTFSFSRFGLSIKVEKDSISNDYDVLRGIALGYYIWMRNDISD